MRQMASVTAPSLVRKVLNFRLMVIISSLVVHFTRTTSAYATGDVRLVGGSKPSEGRVEIYNNGTWGTYCGDSIDVQIAMVICRKGGFPGAALGYQDSREFGAGEGPVYYQGYMSCVGEEAHLGECHFTNYEHDTCSHAKDAGVVCIEPGYLGCFPAGSHFEVNLNLLDFKVGSVDECLTMCQGNEKAYAAVSGPSCFCSDTHPKNSSFGRSPDYQCDITCPGHSRQICGGEMRLSFFSTTTGFCPQLDPPQNGSIDTTTTRFGTTVTFNCAGGFELQGAKKTECVQSDSHAGEFKWDELTPVCKGTPPVQPAPNKDSNVGIISGVVCGVLLVATVMTFIFIYCRQRTKYQRNSLYFRSSWSPTHLDKYQMEAEPHTYESASQGRNSFHSTPLHRAVTPSAASEHEYASYHECHDTEDVTPLHSPLEKTSTSVQRRFFSISGDEGIGNSVMVVNELYNPTSENNGPPSRATLGRTIYEINCEDLRRSEIAIASPTLQRQLHPLPNTRARIDPDYHIYEPEPDPFGGSSNTLEVKSRVLGSQDYAYAEVDPRDSGFGTLCLTSRMRRTHTYESDVMVDNVLYQTEDETPEEEPDGTVMVDNILYHPQE